MTQNNEQQIEQQKGHQTGVPEGKPKGQQAGQPEGNQAGQSEVQSEVQPEGQQKSIVTETGRAGIGQTIREMVRYGAVGVLAFAVDYGTLIFLTEVCGVYYLLSTIFAFCLGILVTYFGSMRFVFQQTDSSHRTRDIMAFLVIGLVGLGLTDLILYLLTERMGIFYLLSKVVATGVVFFWNFFARKIYVIRTNPSL